MQLCVYADKLNRRFQKLQIKTNSQTIQKLFFKPDKERRTSGTPIVGITWHYMVKTLINLLIKTFHREWDYSFLHDFIILKRRRTNPSESCGAISTQTKRAATDISVSRLQRSQNLHLALLILFSIFSRPMVRLQIMQKEYIYIYIYK